MTSCLILGVLITCSGVQPATPDQAIETFMASARPSLPTVAVPAAGRSYLPPPPRQLQWTHTRPLSHAWMSVTTYVPRFGPPVTWFTLPSGQVQPASNAPFVNRPSAAVRGRTR